MWKFSFLVLVLTVYIGADASVATLELPTSLSQSRLRILAEAAEEILKLKIDTLKIAADAVDNINELKKEVKSIVNVSLENVNDQVNDLEDLVKKAAAEAKEKGKCIASCIRRERTSKWLKIRSIRINQCKKTFSFDILKVKLSKLAYVKVEAGTIVPKCLLLHPLSNKNLKNCIQTRIDRAYSTANLIKSQIDLDATQIWKGANNCIEDNLGKLDLDIEKISDDFGECVKNKLKSLE